MVNKINISFKKLDNFDGLSLPSYETSGSAGMDLRAAVMQSMTIASGEYALVPCGFAFALPEGFEAQVRPRSGLAAKHGVAVLNSPGTIDADYRGEIKVILINHGKEPFKIERGMRIAQMVIAPVTQAEFQIVASLDETDRGEGGFGSTGVVA